MRKFLKGIGISLGAIILICILFVIVLFVATRGDYYVLPTVVNDSTTHKVKLNGINLHLQTFGDTSKPLVVVLHDGPGYDYRYLLALAHLSKDYHVIFYDQRGSGLSERVSDDRLTLNDHLTDLDSIVLRYSYRKKVRIIGHGWGAMLASAYNKIHPSNVKQLVLADPLFLTNTTGRLFAKNTNYLSQENSLSYYYTHLIDNFKLLHITFQDNDGQEDFLWHSQLYTPIKSHVFRGFYKDSNVINATVPYWRYGARAHKLLTSLITTDSININNLFIPNPDSTQCNVLFIASTTNTLCGYDAVKQMASSFKNATVWKISGTSHFMITENPKTCIRTIKKFFQVNPL